MEITLSNSSVQPLASDMGIKAVFSWINQGSYYNFYQTIWYNNSRSRTFVPFEGVIEMYSAYKIQIHQDHELFHYCDSLCFKSKNLYNITNYYIRQVYTALKKETRNENQLQVLRDIEAHLPRMNEIRYKSFELAKMKPKLGISFWTNDRDPFYDYLRF